MNWRGKTELYSHIASSARSCHAPQRGWS